LSGDTENPRIWAGADVYVAPVGTARPTNVSTGLNVAFEALGLLSEDDGITESRNEDITDHFAYGGILVRTTRSKHKRSIKVTALEDNPVVFDLVNPGSLVLSTSGVTTRTVKVPTSNPKAFVFELVDEDIVKRLAIPTGEVIEVGDVKISDNAIASRELTINIYPDADGILYYEITDDPQAVEAS
jgi:hypothetical protein